MWCKILILLVIVYQVDFMVNLSPRRELTTISIDHVHEFIVPLLAKTWKVFFGKGIFLALAFMSWRSRKSFLGLILRSRFQWLLELGLHCSNVVLALISSKHR